MKKYFLGVIAVLMVAAVAAWNVNLKLNSRSSNLSGISLANVEALAGDEDDNNNSSPTWQEGEKTITTTTSPGWTWSAGLNLWILNGSVTHSVPPTVETVKFKCCRPTGPLVSCSYENC